MLGNANVPLTGLREFNVLARNLVKIGRCYGLIDKFDPYKVIVDRRAFALGTRQNANVAEFAHSDTAINAIASYVGHKKKERK